VLGNDSLFSYVGPAPDFIPYFLGLVAWAGMALAGILAWPVSAVIGRFRRTAGQHIPQRNDQSQSSVLQGSASESRASKSG